MRSLASVAMCKGNANPTNGMQILAGVPGAPQGPVATPDLRQTLERRLGLYMCAHAAGSCRELSCPSASLPLEAVASVHTYGVSPHSC